jgi:hypothetical protein
MVHQRDVVLVYPDGHAQLTACLLREADLAKWAWVRTTAAIGSVRLPSAASLVSDRQELGTPQSIVRPASSFSRDQFA